MSKKALEHLIESDKKIAALIKSAGPCALAKSVRLNANATPFQALAESIAHQQLTGKAAKTIWLRVLNIFEGQDFTPQQVVKCAPEKLRSAGLSGAKVLALLDLAKQTVAGVVPSSAEAKKLSDAQLIERISSVRGVGLWTVEMFLIFTLGRKDVMPAADYGVRNGFALLYGLKALPKPREVLVHSAIWAPYRSYAAWYLWRAVDLARCPTPGLPSRSEKFIND